MNAPEVERLFNRIAPRYDLINRLMTAGLDQCWRKKLVQFLPEKEPPFRFLDLATGTGDVLVAIADKYCARNLPCHIDGLDLSQAMLERAREKIRSKGFEQHSALHRGNIEALPFVENTYDGVTIAFGIRNVQDRARGLSEIWRVLKPEGLALILEALPPQKPWQKLVQHLHLSINVRLLGAFLSDDKAYAYFGKSVAQFPNKDGFVNMLEGAGFREIRFEPLTLGAVGIFVARK